MRGAVYFEDKFFDIKEIEEGELPMPTWNRSKMPTPLHEECGSPNHLEASSSQTSRSLIQQENKAHEGGKEDTQWVAQGRKSYPWSERQ